MEIDRFKHYDVDFFLELATAEGWICDRWEFDFLINAFPEGCLVCRESGRAAAFVTGITYGKSGWIGNLLVRKDLRGKGTGSALLKRVLAVLGTAGTETVWLTASEAGKSIYEKLGFTAVDVIKRWRGTGADSNGAEAGAISLVDILAMDEAGWGDRREAIIGAVTARSTVFGLRDGFLVSQKCGIDVQLGPWGCRNGEAAGTLLDCALAKVEVGAGIFLDVPVGNIAAASLLRTRGFSIEGSATLMYLGLAPAYHPERIYALASMGSMG
ncbi:MAG: N-acetyltransferase [Geobacteraceae bacterium]|nr:MAG: N-acetyltransferase [Geobacteraceae bacterium]